MGIERVESSDAELVRRIRTGDIGAYGALVSRYRDRLGRYALHMLGDREDAEEALQDSFVRAYRSLARCDDPARFGARRPERPPGMDGCGGSRPRTPRARVPRGVLVEARRGFGVRRDRGADRRRCIGAQDAGETRSRAAPALPERGRACLSTKTMSCNA